MVLKMRIDSEGRDVTDLPGLWDESDVHVPAGYAETMDCMNQPKSWDVPGMIADMAENLRRGHEVPDGQLLAALDWMTFRICESAAAMRDANVTDATKKVLEKLRGF
jgi:hypothetical protein